ncbi:MAG: helix-turn-helix domain-containing protein [Candidatus Cybelea sp.]
MEGGEERALASLTFGTLLRCHRLAVGLSQEALATRAQMSTQGIGALERGDRRTPQRGTLTLLAEALGLDVEQRRAFEAAAARPKLFRPGDGRVSRALALAADELIAQHNLPRQLTSLVGRESIVAEVAALMRKSPLVTLVGSGGVGKTRISLQVATNLLDAFDDGVWFIELAPLSSGEYLPSTVAQILSIQLHGASDPLGYLLTKLRFKNALLIFDNCEHLVDATRNMVAAMLRDCPRIRILASSRQSLGISGESAFRIPSLPVPDAVTKLTGADAGKYAAITLFAERGVAVDSRFLLSDENAAAVGEVCRRLDGIPLAIELAAARIALLSPQQLRDRLDERFRLLMGGRHDLAPRLQTLRATLDWSYGLLDEDERVVARRLGVFVNGFTLEGAIAVGGEDKAEADVFNALASLVDKSLVLADDDGGVRRYRMLESTRAYMREKLEAAGEACVARHLRHLRDIFCEARKQLEETGRYADMERLVETELEDVRFALDRAVQGSEEDVGMLLAAIWDSWKDLDLENEGIARLQRFIALGAIVNPRLMCQLWTSLSRLAHNGQTTLAYESATEALAVARSISDSKLLAYALQAYADAAGLSLRFGEAKAAIEEAETLASRHDNVDLRLTVLQTRGILSSTFGDQEAAAIAYEQVRVALLSLGQLQRAITPGLNLAEAEHQSGRTERALALVQQLRVDLERSSHRMQHLHTTLLDNEAGYLLALDRVPEARAAAREVIRNGDRNHPWVAISIEHLALALALDGDLVRAAQLSGYSDFAFSRAGFERQFTEETTRARLAALFRDRMAPEYLAQLVARGAAMAPDDAVALALQEP